MATLWAGKLHFIILYMNVFAINCVFIKNAYYLLQISGRLLTIGFLMICSYSFKTFLDFSVGIVVKRSELRRRYSAGFSLLPGFMWSQRKKNPYWFQHFVSLNTFSEAHFASTHLASAGSGSSVSTKCLTWKRIWANWNQDLLQLWSHQCLDLALPFLLLPMEKIFTPVHSITPIMLLLVWLILH